MHKVRVGVLRGGPSSAYEVSLKTGATALQHIPSENYEVQDIFIDREGKWHKNGIIITPHHAISHMDIAFNALHGEYGEDGKIQHIFELHKVPFTGSRSFASLFAIDKVLAKKAFAQNKIRTPQYRVVEKPVGEIDPDSLIELFRLFPMPIVVKPISQGLSLGVSIVRSFPELTPALMKAFQYGDTILVEEFIPGIEAMVGVIDRYRDQDVYALPPVEIGSQIAVPGNFSEKEKVELEDTARRVHQILGLQHYSSTDFIISPRRGIYVLEVNALPTLTDESLFSKALHSVGASFSHFFDHILQLALARK